MSKILPLVDNPLLTQTISKRLKPLLSQDWKEGFVWGKIKQRDADLAIVQPIVDKLEARTTELEQALQDDASDLWNVTNAIKKEIESSTWILEGRGDYRWDDDKYRDEARLAFEAVLKLIKTVQSPAQARFYKATGKSSTVSLQARIADLEKQLEHSQNNWLNNLEQIKDLEAENKALKEKQLPKHIIKGDAPCGF